MSQPSTPFYVTGGTLRADAPSYVEREADRDLFEGLSNGEYCFVLNTRQMGKSSLMVRTASRLRQAGVTIAVLDLTAVGQNLTPEQWYEGLLVSLGQQLRLEDELDDFWLDHERLGPLQRWMEAIRQVVFSRLGESGRLVLFIDEIDAVRSLPFAADEFFAAIRECYNRRTRDPEFERICFCLLGVATPADLITEAKMSPFNVGRRIRLKDFSLEDAGKLAAGMVGGVDVLRRVLYWTSGQPYMTQRLCRAVAEDPQVIRPQDVDRLCHQLFLSQQARESDDHLAFVRNRLLRSGVDLASLLDLYLKVRSEGFWSAKVKDDEANDLCATLRLSGIARSENGHLSLRNRVYDRVFDRKWVLENMPGAELRRQREAFRRGIQRASAVGAVAVAVLAGLTGTALTQKAIAEEATGNARLQEARATTQRDKAERLASSLTAALQAKDSAFKQLASALGAERTQRLLAIAARKKADENARLAQEQRALAERQTLIARSENERGRRLLYAAGLNLSQQAIESGNGERAKGILESQQPRSGQVDLRSFDWRFLAAQQRDGVLVGLPGHQESVSALATTAAGDQIVTASEDRTIRIWSLVGTPRQLMVLRGHKVAVTSADINAQGTLVASGDAEGTLRLWDARTGVVRFEKQVGEKARVSAVEFSPDGRRLAVAVGDLPLSLWDVTTHKQIGELRVRGGGIDSLAFFPDGKTLALGATNRGATLWSPTGELPHPALASGAAGTQHLRSVRLQGGVLKAKVTGDDPYWTQSGLNLDPAQVKALRLKLRSTGRGEGSIYWQSFADSSFSEARRRNFSISHDGAFHEIEIPLRGTPSWEGDRITDLRVDPGGAGFPSGADFELAGITALTDAGSVSIPVGQTLAKPLPESRTGNAALTVSTGVAVSPNGQYLAWAEGGSIRLWDVRKNSSGGSILASRFVPTRLLFRWDNSALIALGASFDRGGDAATVVGGFLEWDLAERRLRRVSQVGGVIAAAALLPDGATLAIGQSDGQIALRRLSAPPRPLQEVSYLSDGYAAAWSPDGKTAATGGADGLLRLWNAETWVPLAGMRFPKTLVKLRFSPDNNRLAAADASGRVTLLDVSGPARVAPRKLMELLGHNSITDMSFSKDGKRLATCASANVSYLGDPGDNLHRPVVDASLRIWDLATGRATYEAALPSSSVAFSPDDRYLAYGSEAGTINVVDPSSGGFNFSISGNISAITALAVSPDARMVATGAFDGAVRLFDYGQRAAIVQLRGFTGGRDRCSDIAFSPDGKRLAVASFQGAIQIYDPVSRQLLRTLQHQDSVHALAFAADGKHLLSNGREQIVRIWNVETGVEARRLSVKQKAVAMSPNGDTFARGEEDGSVRTWQSGDIRPVKLLPGLSVPSKRQSARLSELQAQIQRLQKGTVDEAGTGKAAQAANFRPIARFPLSEGAGQQAQDVAGNRVGRAKGPVSWSKGVFGVSLSLDGTGYLDLGDIFNFENDQKFSCGGWVKPSANKSLMTIIGRINQDTGANRGWDLTWRSGKLQIELVSNFYPGQDFIFAETRDVVAAVGEWRHLFATYDGSGKSSGFTLYVDGRPVPLTFGKPRITGSTRGSARAAIGSRYPVSEPGFPFAGELQDISVYDVALSVGQVQTLATSSRLPVAPLPAGIVANYSFDARENGKFPATVGGWSAATPGRPVEDVAGRFGAAVKLSGASLLPLPGKLDFDTSSAFTVGVWVKPETSRRGALISNQAAIGGMLPGWEVWIENQQIYVELTRSYPADWLMVRSQGAPLTLNRWRHVLFTHDGSGKAAGIRLYVDGVRVPVETVADNLKGSIRSETPVHLGSRSGSWPLAASLDEVSIFSSALTPAEVERLAAASWVDLVLSSPSTDRSPELQALASRVEKERRASAALLSARKDKEDLTAEVEAQAADLSVVVYSPDGRRMLIAGRRGDSRVVDARDGKSLADFPAPASLAAFSSDGRLVATSDAKTAHIWDVDTGRGLGQVPIGTGAVQALTFQQDRRVLVVAVVEQGNTRLIFWDADRRREGGRLSLRGSEATSVEASPGGHLLAVGTASGQIRRWELPLLRELAPLDGHRGSVTALAFSSDGVTLASGSRDATVRFWNLLAGREVVALRGHHKQAVTHARFSKDGQTLMTTSADAPVRVWLAPDPSADRKAAAELGGRLKDPPSSPPIRVRASSGPKGIELKWAALPGVSGYEVRRSISEAGPFISVGRTSEPSYQDPSAVPGVRYRYSIAGVTGRPGRPSQPITVLCAGRPAAPGGLSAQAFGRRVDLTWDAVEGVERYTVTRAARREGPYTVLAKDAKEPYFQDTNAPEGELHYRVAALVGSEPGEPSEPITVRPPWTLADIATSKPGDTRFLGAQIQLTGFGSQIGGTADQCRFTYQLATGDVELAALVEPSSGGSAAARAGLMFRSSDTSAASCLYLGLQGGSTVFLSRDEFGKAATPVATASFPGTVRWLKLARRGSRFTALASADGKAWLALAWTTQEMPSELLAGVAVSGSATSGSSATFTDVRIGPVGRAVMPSDNDSRLPAPAGASLINLARNDLYGFPELSRVTVEGGALRVSREKPVEKSFSTGFAPTVRLADGEAYILQFRARADRPRTAVVGVQAAGGNYVNRGLNSEFPLETEWRWYRSLFTASVKEPLIDTTFYFHLGADVGDIWISDVALVSQRASGSSAAAGTVDPRLPALPVDLESTMRTGKDSRVSVIQFVNRTNRALNLVWLNQQGERKDYGSLAAGASRDQVTSIDSVWLALLPDGGPIALFVSKHPKAVAEITQGMINPSLYPVRAENLGPNLIDLTQFYNAGLKEPWHASAGYTLSMLPTGVSVVNGISFDIRGVISLNGSNLEQSRPGTFPTAVEGIPVGRRVESISFLHSTGWFAPDNAVIGRYVIHYADGEQAVMPIVYGKDVRDWASDSTATPAPSLRSGTLRLFTSTWRNPRPEAAVLSFDYESTMTTAAPFLVAATAALPEPVLAAGADGGFMLSVDDAALHGGVRRQVTSGETNVGYWDRAEDYLTWKIRAGSPGVYRVLARIATPNQGAVLSAEVGSAKAQTPIPPTGSYLKYADVELGSLKIDQAGVHTVSLRPGNAATWKPVNVVWLKLVKQ